MCKSVAVAPLSGRGLAELEATVKMMILMLILARGNCNGVQICPNVLLCYEDSNVNVNVNVMGGLG